MNGEAENKTQDQNQNVDPQLGAGGESNEEALKQKRDKIQRRISQLWGEKKQAQEEAALYKQQFQELQAQLQATQEELALLKSNAGSGLAVPNVSGFGSSPAADPSQVKQLVTEAVKETVGPLLDEFQKTKQVQELRVKQREAYMKAVTEFPELADPSSDLFQATDEVLKRNPKLANDPEGPLTAALIAQGILARAGSELSGGPIQQATPQQKAAASVPPPSAGVNLPAGPKQQLQQLEQQYEELMTKLRNTVDTVEIQKLWRERSSLVAQMEGLRKQAGS